MVESLISSLLLTLLIELSFALVFKVRGKRDILIVFLANVVTNPVIVTIENLLWSIKNQTVMMILSIVFWIMLEILVIIVEGYIYKWLDVKSKFSHFKLSFALNSISIICGILLAILRTFLVI